MKNLYFFAFLSFCNFFVAQNPIYRLDSITSPGVSSQVFTYNINDQHIRTKNYQFDMGSGSMALMDQTTFIFDGNGMNTEQEFSSVINSVLTPNVKTLMSYNASGDLLSFTNLWYDVAASQYWNSNKTDYVRDGNGNILQELFFNWQGGSWIMSGKNRYMYNANGFAISSTMTNTFDNGVTFDSVSKILYTYNVANQPIEELFQNWQTTSWFDINKTTYAYDGAGNMNLALYYNPQGPNWAENFKEELTHNAVGDYVQYNSYLKNGVNWDPQYQLVNVFDTPLLQDLIVSNDYEFGTKLDASEIYQPAGQNWSLIKLNNYHYTQIGAGGIDEMENEDFVIYPNPATHLIYLPSEFNEGSAMITDLSGKALVQLKLEEKAIDVSSLSNGTYFIRVFTNNHLKISRFTVVK